MESKYLKRFKRLQQDGSEVFQLRGDRILVEVLPKEELKSKGGLLLTTSINQKSDTKENQATLAIVLLAGEGYYGDNDEDVPLSVKQGDIVLLSAFGLKHYTTFPGLQEYTANEIALTRDAEIHMIFPGFQAYEKVKGLLNG